MEEYLEWLYYDILNGPDSRFKAYRSLFTALLGIPYRYTHRMDRNRFKDGLELRETYCREFGVYWDDICSDLDIPMSDFEQFEACKEDECSVFEMFVAFAYRIEKDIMAPMEGDFDCFRWFWGFIEALELDEFDENSFDEGWIYRIIDDFEDGKTYIFDGFEGDREFGELQLWDQMNEFLADIT